MSHFTPSTDKSAYIIECEGQDLEVIDAEICRNFEYRARTAESDLKRISDWNDAECQCEAPEEIKHWDKAFALLHNRHAKSDLVTLIADLLAGKTPKVLK